MYTLLRFLNLNYALWDENSVPYYLDSESFLNSTNDWISFDLSKTKLYDFEHNLNLDVKFFEFWILVTTLQPHVPGTHACGQLVEWLTS